MRVPLAIVLLLTIASANARAESVGFRSAHPIAWMHQLPIGESPGWTGAGWFNLEVGQANVWNKSSAFTNRATNHRLTYEADFEQTTVVADLGLALSDRLAVAVEVPYANRNGGFMDAVIDQFHLATESTRFLRNRFGEFGNHFYLKDEGIDQLATPHAEGVGSLKGKVKYRLLTWTGDTPGSCDCGVSVSAQIKTPVQRPARGLTSGQMDSSVLVHFGIPIGTASGVWATAAYTRLGSNPSTAAWPMIRDQRMAELYADLGLWSHLGLILSVRTESPLVDRRDLIFESIYVDPEAIKFERTASGWNALTEWRGSQGFGVRWRWGAGQQFNLMMTEDFGLGDRDGLGADFYSNNAPDVGLLSQLHLAF